MRVRAADLDLCDYARKVETFLAEVAAATRAWSTLLGGTLPTPLREPRVFFGTHYVPWDAPGGRLATALREVCGPHARARGDAELRDLRAGAGRL